MTARPPAGPARPGRPARPPAGPGRPARPARRALPRSFYARPTLDVARDLIGCVVTHGATSGVIVETEAYHMDEPACHAFVGVTPRTATLFGPPGVAYVYRSYGVHALLNAVTEREDVGAAVLIRALEPLDGVELMRERRGGVALEQLCSGPGKLTQALDVELDLSGTSLLDGEAGGLSISARPRAWRDPAVVTSTRIGITKAADLPWRFSAAGSRHVSKPWPV